MMMVLTATMSKLTAITCNGLNAPTFLALKYSIQNVAIVASSTSLDFIWSNVVFTSVLALDNLDPKFDVTLAIPA